MTATTHPDPPRPSVREMQERLATELSVGKRVGLTLLLVLDLAVAVGVASLWLTEPWLPPRTHAAFGAVFVLALVWAGVFLWTLTKRKVLLARHRVVTTSVAVAATATFVAGALAVALTEPTLRQPGLYAATCGVLFLAVALTLWRRATHRFRDLADRVRALERELAATAP